MGNVVELDAFRPNPHVQIAGRERVHVVPLSFFEDVIAGKRSISDMDDLDDVLHGILKDWLMVLKARSE